MGVPQELTPLLEELASPVRMRLLHTLAQSPGTLTALSGTIGLSPQEVSRHLARLGGQALVYRDATRAYRLTPFAHVLLEELPTLQALHQRRGFFEAHDLSALPPGPVRPVAAAQHLVASEAEVRQRLQEGLQHGTGPVALVAPHLAGLTAALCARAAGGSPLELVVPWTLAGSEELLALDGDLGREGVQRTTVRLVERAPMLLLRTSPSAYALFLTPQGALDETHLVWDDDAAFLGWAEDCAAKVRAASVPAFDPARHRPEEWRWAITVAAGTFVGRRRGLPPATAGRPVVPV